MCYLNNFYSPVCPSFSFSVSLTRVTEDLIMTNYTASPISPKAECKNRSEHKKLRVRVRCQKNRHFESGKNTQKFRKKTAPLLRKLFLFRALLISLDVRHNFTQTVYITIKLDKSMLELYP